MKKELVGCCSSLVPKTVSLTNLILNGNFTSATSWSHSGASLNVASNEATFVGNSANDYVRQLFNTPSGHKFFVCGWLKANATNAKIGFTDGASINVYANHSGGDSYEFLGIVTGATVNTNAYCHAIIDSRASFTDQVKYVSVIDLTAAFGAGKEPTAAQMLGIMAGFENNWLNGTQTAVYYF